MNSASVQGSSPQPRALIRLDELLFRLETVFNLVAALFIFALMIIGVVQVVGRTVFNFPIFGYIDLIELSMATFAFMGAAYCQRLGGHVRMELFLKFASRRALWIAEMFGTVGALFIVAVLVWYGWEHFLRAWELGDSTIDAEYPLWPSKLVVPIAFAVLWLRLLIQFAGYFRLIRAPDAVPVAVPLIASIEEQAAHEIHDALGELQEDKGGGRAA